MTESKRISQQFETRPATTRGQMRRAMMWVRFARIYLNYLLILSFLLLSLGAIDQLEGAAPCDSFQLLVLGVTSFSLMVAIHLARLAKANPDSYLAKLMRGEGAPGETGHEAEALEQNLVRRGKQWRRLRVLLLAAGLAGLTLEA
jgi:hypothetical protein